MECPGEIEVLAWLHGRLAPEALDRLDTHLDGCRECLATVAALGRIGAAAAPAGDGERYVVGDEIARGGMGQVFAATDRVLDRPVAVKTARDPVGAARFAREMRITARLQHPAIVPVYDAGAFPDGEPFYVMRHVDGVTLDRAAAAAATLADRIALLPAVMTAIDAVAYAHDCGIIHRDLKPANLLVGRFGETVVLDWGLAKILADPEAEPDAELPPATAAAESSLTRAGEVLGTPAYMAPEQAVGEPADTRSDVYGLGAILYHLLTGAAPRRIATAPVAPIAEREPELPAELAAIVDRAMAIEPDDRYPGARALGDDLRRFQAGRLVSAHRYTARELVRRWASRHRAALIAATAAIVVVVVIGVIAVRRVVVARDSAEVQRAGAVASRATAETQRAAAEHLVAFMLDDLRTRLDVIGRLDVMAGVGDAIDAYYGRLPVRDGPDGADELLRRSDGLATLGDARRAVGDLEGARTAYAREAELVAAAAARRPDARATVAACLVQLRLGDLARGRGDDAGARAAYGTCVGPTVPGGAGPDLAAKLQDLRIQGLLGLGELDMVNGRFDDAAARLGEAERLATGLAATGGPSAKRGRDLLIVVTDTLGNLGVDRGDLEQARTAFAANLARAEADAAARTGDADAQHQLAETLIQVGRTARFGDDPAAALAAFARARGLDATLVARDPDNQLWQEDLAMVDSQLGVVEQERGDLNAALADLEASQVISKQLSERDPDDPKKTREVGGGALQLGDLERARRHTAAARAHYLEAVATDEHLATAYPDDAEAQRDLAVALLHLGDLDRERGASDAAATLERSVVVMRGLLARTGTPRARTDLVSALLALSDAQPRAAARATIDEARTAVEPLRATISPTSPDDAELRQAIADVDEAWATVKP